MGTYNIRYRLLLILLGFIGYVLSGCTYSYDRLDASIKLNNDLSGEFTLKYIDITCGGSLEDKRNTIGELPNFISSRREVAEAHSIEIVNSELTKTGRFKRNFTLTGKFKNIDQFVNSLKNIQGHEAYFGGSDVTKIGSELGYIKLPFTKCLWGEQQDVITIFLNEKIIDHNAQFYDPELGKQVLK